MWHAKHYGPQKVCAQSMENIITTIAIIVTIITYLLEILGPDLSAMDSDLANSVSFGLEMHSTTKLFE